MSSSSESARFEALFKWATEEPSPLPYQTRLALKSDFRALADIPTGMGKTAAAILSWVWRRRFSEDTERSKTPRRLVYCLPMRVLVEQTFGEAVKWLARLGLLAGPAQWTDVDSDGLPAKHAKLDRSKCGYRAMPEAAQVQGWAAANGDRGRNPIAVHLLLGGEERTDWALWPDRDAILIGTQDMLLSRALNRGYAAGRARWPLEFGLLNNDCLWVFDEVQLMSTGLASSLQLDAWRRSLCLRPSRDQFPKGNNDHLAKPCQSLWMSATMAEHWLDSAVDWSEQKTCEWGDRVRLDLDDARHERVQKLFEITKPIERSNAALQKPGKADKSAKQSDYILSLAKTVSAPGTSDGLTLVILNTVERAVQLYKALKDADGSLSVDLVHSRFRPFDREQWNLSNRNGTPRIIVSTQVVEAGVDLSAWVLFTELAPWASMVQRFGRCARYPGESGNIFWMEVADEWAKPYEAAELAAARQQLQPLNDVGLKSLRDLRAHQDDRALFPYEPRFVPRDKDLFDLFDTSPDLTGADVDVSRFIRNGEELDVQVFWREVAAESQPAKKVWPDHRELCPVPFYLFRDALPSMRKAGRVWCRNYRKGWELVSTRDADLVYPGQVYLLEKSCGGYSPNLGWTGNPDHVDFELPEPLPPTKETLQDDEDDADDLSQLNHNQWLSVLEHTMHVCRKLDELLRDCDLPDSEQKILKLAARWHDRGKAHPVFQAKIKLSEKAQEMLAGEPAAKAPDGAWQQSKRPGFRHELASALAILETLRCAQPGHEAFAWPKGLERPAVIESTAAEAGDGLADELARLSADELDLFVYLVAAHHGKVRMSIRSAPHDERRDVPDPCPDDKRQARGVRDGEELPPCRIPSADLNSALVAPAVTFSLDPMELGLSDRYGPSWRERTQLLLERLGPFRLAYLEGLLRAADCRASREEEQGA